MADLKVSKEMASAAMIHAMLTGGTDEPSKPVEKDEEVINGIEIDIDLDGKKKKKSSSGKAKKVKKTDEEIAAEKAAADRLPDWEYGELMKSQKFIVVLNQHDIHYKEQRWPIDERKVIYEASRVDSRLAAKRSVRDMYGDKVTAEQLEKAESGEIRYYDIRVLNEIVPTRVTRLGYIEIRPDKKNLIKLNRKDMENHNIVYEDVLADVKKVAKSVVKYN